MAEYVSDLVERNHKPELKLYARDLKGLKDIDVDDKCCLHVKVKAMKKYHAEYEEGNPLCITFEITKVEKCEDCK
jgi:hypothetical protein